MKKIGLLCLALVLALGALGVGYAMWDKTLYIDGTVNTGEVNMEILSVSSDDPPPDGIVGDIYPGSGTIDPGFMIDGVTPKDKNVGATSAIVGADKQSIEVTVTNAYPSYECYVHFSVRNSGTIPVKLQAINVAAPPEITVEGWDHLGEQLEPSDKSDNTIWFHVLQCADELATYNFTVEFHYVQWNEYTP